jgi:biopolymer transport protein ExbD
MGMNVNLDDGGGAEDAGEAQESVVAEINITPLTDVFLVLLIIFMVTSTALVETAETQARSGVKVALPKSNATAAVTNRKRDPIVTVNRENQIFLNTSKTPIAIADLEATLTKALQDSQSDTLLLRTDTNTVMGAAVNVMSVGKKVGFKTIAILTEGGGKK